MTSSKVPTRQLGKDGPQVTALGFGAMGLSAFYGTVDTDESRFAVLDKAYELGCTFWDTSDAYGDSEDLLRKWFARTGKRDDIFLATKFAGLMDAEGKYTLRSDAAYVKEACEKSLKRLGVERIDLYYCHRVDGVTPIEETVGAMVELKKQNKISHLGLCEISSFTLRRASAIHPISALQIEYSPFTTDIEHPATGPLLSTCRALGTALVAYSPLGRGMLTGTIKSPDDLAEGDWRRFMPRFSEENFAGNLKLVEVFEEVAKGKGAGCTSGQVALAWLMGQGADVIPIPGTRKVKYLEENVGAWKVGLSEEEMKLIRKAVDEADVMGDRYPEEILKGCMADTPELKGKGDGGEKKEVKGKEEAK